MSDIDLDTSLAELGITGGTSAASSTGGTQLKVGRVPTLVSLEKNSVVKFLDEFEQYKRKMGEVVKVAIIDCVDRELLNVLLLMGKIRKAEEEEVTLFLNKLVNKAVTDFSVKVEFTRVKFNVKLDVTDRVVDLMKQVTRELTRLGWMKEIDKRERIRKEILACISDTIQPLVVKKIMLRWLDHQDKTPTIAEYSCRLEELVLAKEEEQRVFQSDSVVQENGKRIEKPKRKDIACFGCKGHGHLLKDCRSTPQAEKDKLFEELKKGVQTRKKIMQLKLDESKLCVLTVLIGGKEIDAVLDSGAEANFISQETANMISNCTDQVIDASERNITVGDGSHVKVTRKLETEISFLGSTKRMKVMFLVLPATASPMLLGIPFLHSLDIDLRKEVTKKLNNDVELAVKEDEQVWDEFKQFVEDGEQNVEEKVVDLEEDEKLPNIKSLFPIFDQLIKEDQIKVMNLYNRLTYLLYRGDEEMVVPPYKIELLKDAKPFWDKTRRFSPRMIKFLCNEAHTMVEKGLLVKAETPTGWGSCAFGVPKKPNSKDDYRLVVNYVGVNELTVKVPAVMPLVETRYPDIVGSKFFAVIDARKGYHQIAMEEESSKYLAIIFPDGLYYPRRLIPGTCNATGHFQMCISNLLGCERIITWLDDSLLFSPTLDAHIQLLEDTLNKLKKARVKLNLSKCVLMSSRIKFFGRIFSDEGMQMDDERVRTLLELPVPQDAGKLSEFLNCVNWSRDFIPSYSNVSSPLYKMINDAQKTADNKKKAALSKIKLTWTEDQIQSFIKVKQILAGNITLNFPDGKSELFLFSDASDTHHAAMLTQVAEWDQKKDVTEQQHEILGFTSGAFKNNQVNWDIANKEMFAALFGLTKLEYLIGTRISLVMDHKNFQELAEASKNLNGVKKEDCCDGESS